MAKLNSPDKNFVLHVDVSYSWKIIETQNITLKSQTTDDLLSSATTVKEMRDVSPAGCNWGSTLNININGQN